MFARTLAVCRKFVVAILAAVAQAVAVGLIDGGTAQWVFVAIAALGAVGVYAVPNAPAAADDLGTLREP